MDSHCTEAAELLYSYMDGELTEERRVLIATHLDACPPCLDAFDFEAELRVVISERCRERVPDQLRQRVADALAQLQTQT